MGLSDRDTDISKEAAWINLLYNNNNKQCSTECISMPLNVINKQ